MNELNQPIFHTEHASLLSESAVFALWTYAFPVVGSFLCFARGGYSRLGTIQSTQFIVRWRDTCVCTYKGMFVVGKGYMSTSSAPKLNGLSSADLV